MNPLDAFLNRITMYRLVLYYLCALFAAAFFFSFFGVFPFTPTELVFSGVVIFSVGWLTNALFVKAFAAMPGSDSVYITALILTLIITPVAPTDLSGLGFTVAATVWAMASKYLLTYRKKHFFNPAALGVALATFLLPGAASWWVGGNVPLMALVVTGGVCIVRKIHRFDLVTAFGVVALLTISLTTPNVDFFAPMQQALLHTPFFFLAFVMLTEPLTTPPTRWMRVAYGALVGFLFAPNIHLGSFYLTPELALIIGNVFVFVVSPKGRSVLTLIERKILGPDTMEFVFKPDYPLAFAAGQYLEWTLPHTNHDARGNRRYFTIASAPTEDTVRLGVKFSEPASTFKKALLRLRPNDQISATGLAGDFTLPKDPNQKLAFIAGGIGITPFRSQIQHLLDTQERRSVVLFYAAKTESELAYRNLFARAEREMGMKTVFALSDEQRPGRYSGFLTREILKKEMPDYKERMFYLSGPHSMVDAFQKTLWRMGVPPTRIKTDYFPGF